MSTLPPCSDPVVLGEAYPRLWEHVRSERVALYEGVGASEEEAVEFERGAGVSRVLLGWCTLNATCMARRLFDHGYSPEIVLGYLDIDGEVTPCVSSGREAVESTVFHTWVEVDGVVVEPATEWSRARGLPYISERVPGAYREPCVGARFVWEPWMTHEIVGVEARLDEFFSRV